MEADDTIMMPEAVLHLVGVESLESLPGGLSMLLPLLGEGGRRVGCGERDRLLEERNLSCLGDRDLLLLLKPPLAPRGSLGSGPPLESRGPSLLARRRSRGGEERYLEGGIPSQAQTLPDATPPISKTTH